VVNTTLTSFEVQQISAAHAKYMSTEKAGGCGEMQQLRCLEIVTSVATLEP
jgi:hypothetical protein